MATERPEASAYDRRRLRAGLRRLAETGASTLEVARTAVWVYEGGRDRLHRIHLYHRSSGEHVAGGELRREHYPAYFEALDALEGDETLAAADVHRDPRTAELSETYATPVGLNAWIDVPMPAAGGHGSAPPAGILRFEHLGPARRWTERERAVARGLAAAAGALLAYFGAGDGAEAAEEREAGPADSPPADSPPADGAVSGRPRPARPARTDGSPLDDVADELEGALEAGRLALRWQPIQRAADGARVGAEALVRMVPADGGGPVPAARFVGRAEEDGLAPALDRWVLERATGPARAWLREEALDWIALNVSPYSLVDGDYREALEAATAGEGSPPAGVLLQVTLDLDAHPLVDVGRALFELRSRGFGVCLDLRGATGETLEVALTALPADVLEVDPGRVERWAGGAVPEAVREARRTRGLRLLAKRLETPDQARRARALECEMLSGRLVGPPVEAGALAGAAAGA